MYIPDDGIRISATLEMPETNPGKCPLFIVIHGFTSCKDRPHTIAACKAIRDAGFATLRADMYGHGESGGAFRDHTLFKWISNIMALIDYARGLDFVTEIWLSGHSQGGLAAALVAGMAPDRVSGLILRAPAFLIPESARTGRLLGESFDPDHIPDTVQTIKGLTLGGNYIRVAQTIHPEEAIDRFRGPVLILQGENDDLIPAEDSAAAAERYRNGTLAMIPGENHSFDFHQDRMQELIREWLAGRAARVKRKRPSLRSTVAVNGVTLHYEATGEGRPIVLVHGNGEDHHLFDVETEQLAAAGYRVYAPDSRGHGANEPLDEYHYADMAEDMYQFIRALNLGTPAFYGFSDGGIIGLMLILAHPGCLSTLAISGTNLSPEGIIPSFIEEYTALNQKKPDPLVTLMLTEPHIDPERLREISVPVLVTAGENDLILRSETEKIAGMIPGSTLKILPGHDHGSYIAGSRIMGEILIDFLKEKGQE